MKTERSGGIYDKEYLSVPVVYRPQGASWTFQLALFLSPILYARPPLKRVKSACLDGNRWLLPTSSPTGFWSLGCLCISEWAESRLQTPHRWLWFLWVMSGFFSTQKLFQSHKQLCNPTEKTPKMLKKKKHPPQIYLRRCSFIIPLKGLIIFCRFF